MSIPRRKLLGARNMQVGNAQFFANFAVKILLEVEKLNRKDREAIAKDAKKGLNYSGLVFLVFALEIGNTSVTLEVPNARRHFVNQILVMRDQQNRSLIALQSNVQRVDRFQVQVVGGFIQHQDVRFLQHQLAEQQARGFASGEDIGALVAVVFLEEHLTEQAANFFVRCIWVPLMQPFEGCSAGLNQRLVILSEVADRRLVPPDDFASGEEGAIVAAGFAQFGIRDCRRIRQQCIQHGGLTHTVTAQQGDFFSAHDAGGESTDHRIVVVGFFHAFQFQDMFAGRTLHFELDERALNVGAGEFGYLQALDRKSVV